MLMPRSHTPECVCRSLYDHCWLKCAKDRDNRGQCLNETSPHLPSTTSFFKYSGESGCNCITVILQSYDSPITVILQSYQSRESFQSRMPLITTASRSARHWYNSDPIMIKHSWICPIGCDGIHLIVERVWSPQTMLISTILLGIPMILPWQWCDAPDRSMTLSYLQS